MIRLEIEHSKEASGLTLVDCIKIITPVLFNPAN